MDPRLAAILDDARAQIARGGAPDPAELEARIQAVGGPEAERALQLLTRLLAVHRARRSVATPPTPVPASAPARRREYRAKPTIAANMTVRARATGETVTLEWQPAIGVVRWEARVSERPDPRSDYVDGVLRDLDAPRLELRLTDRPQRIHLLGRNAAGRLVQRALVSGLTRANWNQRWLQRASAA